MSSTKQMQPVPPEAPFQWQNEKSDVDLHNTPARKLRRTIKRLWLPVLILSIIFSMLMSAEVMASVLPVLEVAFQVIALIFIFISQFIVLFWFLARTRTYTIMPDAGTEGINFDDYRGQPEILEQAQQIVTLLRGVKAFENAGGEPLTGLLLEGPPGTGKTWLAQAISTEARVPFFYMDASGLQAMFIGVGPMKVMGLFRKARKMAKRYGAAVIFLDEIDAVGSRGGGVAQVGGSEEKQDGMFGGGYGGMGVLSTLLVEMDGFSQEHGWRANLRSWWYKTILRRKPPKPDKRVLVIGATNRISALDPALLRPGRFDKKIRVDVPDMEGRREILEYYLQKYAHDDTMDPAILASETPGYSPADLKYLLNEALRYAFFEGRRVITYRDFMRAQPEHEMGLRAPLKHMSQEAKRRQAYYYAGQAVAIRLFLPHHRISRVTIVRQGFHFGHVFHYSARESFQGLQIKPELLNRVRVSIAGKAAEIEFCGVNNQSMLVSDDLNEVLRQLGRMANAGMFETMGATMSYGFDYQRGIYAQFTPEQAKAIETVYQTVLRETREALREHAHIVNALVDLLMEKEELLTDEIRAFFDQYGLHTPDPTIIRDGTEYLVLPPSMEHDELPEGASIGLRGSS
jgi:cell division protease FtsH